MSVAKTCQDCGKAFEVPPSRAGTARYCSLACSTKHNMDGKGKSLMLVCASCGASFKSPISQAHRRRFCSRLCQHSDGVYREQKSSGRVGALNPQWQGGRKKRSDGYVYAQALHHPLTTDGYVLEHRLVMEEWLRDHAPDSPFLVQLGKRKYLSREFEVHHKDEDRANNDIENLVCLTPAEHKKLHAKPRR